MSTTSVQFRSGLAYHWATVLATIRMHLQWSAAHAISGIQVVLFPLLSYVTWRVAYAVSRTTTIGGVDPSAFLLVGMVGLLTWQSTVKGSGSAIQYERNVGTLGALLLTPVSRAATILGHGLASFVELLPAYAVIIVLGVVVDAHVNIRDPWAVAVALLALIIASLATGFALAGLFILSRRGNLLANALQSPIYLLAGFIVPRSSLPWWLRPVSNLIPAGPATDALRASTLAGASLGTVAQLLAHAVGTSALWALLGYVALRRVEDAAKRSGQLDLE